MNRTILKLAICFSLLAIRPHLHRGVLPLCLIFCPHPQSCNIVQRVCGWCRMKPLKTVSFPPSSQFRTSSSGLRECPGHCVFLLFRRPSSTSFGSGHTGQGPQPLPSVVTGSAILMTPTKECGKGMSRMMNE